MKSIFCAGLAWMAAGMTVQAADLLKIDLPTDWYKTGEHSGKISYY